jgi:cytochrome c-type biogenesis protein CcmH/NrfF
MDRIVSRRRLPFVLAVGLALLCAVAASVLVARGAVRPVSLDARVQQVAETLSCPACQAESVAASNAPIAQSMRSEIRHQLRQGRTPQQIRSWFRNRYGDQVVLLPGSHGPDLLLWALPVVVLVGGAAAGMVVVRRRRHRPATRRTGSSLAVAPWRLAVVGCTCAAVGAAVPVVIMTHSADSQPPQASLSSDLAPATVAQWRSLAGSLEEQGKYDAAAAAWRKALQLRPRSAAMRTSMAFDLLRSGDSAQAERVAGPIARTDGAQRAMAMLVVGLAQRDRHEPAATHTLRTFLHDYPHHPAADQVRRLLREQP